MTTDSLPSTRRAIILAAGLGRRLRPALDNGAPKCLTPLGHASLLAHQMRRLQAVGVDDLVVVVGHGADSVRREAEQVAGAGMQVRFVENEEHARTNTLVSFALAADFMDQPFFGLNGDVLFSRRLLAALSGSGHAVALAVEVKACGDEEVKVVADETQRVSALGKTLPPARCVGEFVGVAHFELDGAEAFRESLATTLQWSQSHTAYFEEALAHASQRVPVMAVLLESDEPVIEIDFPEDLARARDDILPRVEAIDDQLDD